MGYTNHYSESIRCTGSVPYTYPRSDSGGSGSASYDFHVPVDIYINVDTDPFDNSINGFNKSANVLTGSVVAMNTAQCAAIQQTAKEISASMINGFFNIVSTELSQQIQALDSAMKAGLVLLLEQGKSVETKKSVMEGDYNRISSRYIRLFDDLDSECYKRIHTLDRHSFNLAEKIQKDLVSDPSCDTAALNVVGIGEILSSKTMMFVSSINRKTLDVLRTLSDYVTQELKLNSLIESFLVSEKVDENIPLDIPVIWSESDMTEGTGASTSRECFVPAYIGGQGRQAITEKVSAFCAGTSVSGWEPMAETETELLNKEFNVLAERHFANADDEGRVYKTMLSLWQNTKLFSLKRSPS